MVTNLFTLNGARPPVPEITTDKMVSPDVGYKGYGSPEGVIPARVGQTYLNRTTGQVWVKTSGDLTKGGWEPDDDSESDIVATDTTEARSSADRWAEVGNIKDFGAVSNGATDALNDLNAALAANDTILFTDGSFLISQDITIPAGKVLIFQNGAKLKPASGKKITINAEVQAGRFEIFDYSAGGKAVLGFFGRTDVMFPEWWGAKADNSTNNETAFARMLDPTLGAAENAQPIDLCQGYYKFITGFTVRQNMSMRGNPNGKTRLLLTAAADAVLLTIPADSGQIELQDIQLATDGTAALARTTAIKQLTGSVGGGLSGLSIKRCDFTGFNQFGIDLDKAQYVLIDSQCRFISIANLVSQGGTGLPLTSGAGHGPAICFYVRTYVNAVTISAIRVGICDKFCTVVDTSAFTLEDSALEQGDTTSDAASAETHFVEISSGAVINVEKNYFEGIKTTGRHAIVALTSCKAYSISKNRFALPRPSESVSSAIDVVGLMSGNKGGSVNDNEFVGAPVGYYIYITSSSDKPSFLRSAFLTSAGASIGSSATIALSTFPALVEFDTSERMNLAKERHHSSYTSDAGTEATVVYPRTDKRFSGGSAAAAGFGLGQKWTLQNSTGAQEDAAVLDIRWNSPTAAAEIANVRVQVCNASALVTGLEVYGAGGTKARGNVMPTVQVTATSLGATQASGQITVTATGQTITLPASTTVEDGMTLTIKLRIGGAGSCTVARAGSDTIDGATSYSLSADYKFVTIRLDKTNATWDIIASN